MENLYKQILLKTPMVILLKILPPLGILSLNLYLAMHMTPNDYGNYSIGFSQFLFFGPILTLGLSEVVLRKTAIFSNKNDEKKANYLFCVCIVICCLFGTTFSLLLWMFNEDGGFSKIPILSPIIALGLIYSARYRGLGGVFSGQVFETIFRSTLAIILLFYIITFQNPLIHLYDVFIMVFIINLVIFYHYFPVKIGDMSRNFNQGLSRYFNYRFLKVLMKNAFPNMVITLVQGLKNFGDIFVVAIILGSTSVATYSIAIQIVVIMSLVQMAISIVTSNAISVNMKIKNYEKVRKLYLFNVKISLSFSLLFFIVLILLGDFFIKKFLGESYEKAYYLCIILCLGRLVHSFIGPVMQVLILSNNQLSASKVTTYIAVSNIILCFISAELFGIFGLATTTSIIFVFWSIMLKRVLIKTIPLLNLRI
jgi:O-antigen/teichoic acid export membrane protein